MWSLLVFAVIGLLTGGAARLLYPGRRSLQILITLSIGIVGAIAGGMISRAWWPGEDGEFHTGNLMLSMLGAVLVIMVWAALAYKRSLQGLQNTSR
jgi:uncharacterized membrane protein YeaQ/YmgE (transglycosylase-associated protein family)